MKVLGIEIQGSDTIVVTLSGTKAACTLLVPTRARIALPRAGNAEIKNLLLLKEHVRNLIHTLSCERVAYIAADASASVMRAKLECMVQLAADEQNVISVAVPWQGVAADQKRRVENTTGHSLEDLVGGIKPKYLTKAVYCAWSQLSD